MDMVHINQLRKANEVPFRVVDWLEALTPVVVSDELGTMYRGCIMAEDGYGKYAAIVGTTDMLLKTPPESAPNGTPYRILKLEKRIVPFGRQMNA